MSMIKQEKQWLGSKLRYGTDDDVVWFVLKDVCGALGIKNHRDVATRLKEDHGDCVGTADVTDALGRHRQTTIVMEDLVYAFIVPKSRKPEALKFSRWVGEVIRTVRQTGRYEAPKPTVAEAIEMQRLQMDMVRMTLDLFGDDDRMCFLAKERMASIVSGQKAITDGDPPITVSEIMEELGLSAKFVLKNRSRFGKHVANRCKEEGKNPPLKVKKLVNGHACSVNAYPAAEKDMVVALIKELL
jgi:prophage antirepressor-like protein